MHENLDDETAQQPNGLDPEELFRMAWLFYLALAVAGVVWIGLAQGGLTLGLFFDPAAVWIDLALGLACTAVLAGGWRLLRRLVVPMRQLEDLMRPWFASLDSSQVFVLALISGFSEELFFRGALQSSLGWIWATLIFTLLHSGPGSVFRIWTAFALVAGLLFAVLTHVRGNIFAAFMAHFLVNWINLYALTAQPPKAPAK